MGGGDTLDLGSDPLDDLPRSVCAVSLVICGVQCQERFIPILGLDSKSIVFLQQMRSG